MYWKLALAQHPMYLLIKEDSICAERTPPWGAPDIGRYIDRLRQNITTLRKYPQLKIGYEWSGLELEQLKEDAPDVIEEMLDLVKGGQSTFYNGTYSQPHLQTLSSEANYRQFEWGARVYHEICNHQVKVYAHQESSINEQSPQLLRAFGIGYGVMPHFSSTLMMLDGGEILYHSNLGSMFLHGEEFTSWRGLDGTTIDLYLNEPKHGFSIQDWLAYQEVIGLTHVPPIVVEMPDLIDVDDNWIHQRAKAEFVLLDKVLEERRKDFPPRFHVRFYSNWSYVEGIRAEELSRSNFKAETAALRAEALGSLAFALLKRPSESTDSVWKKILTTQHHDVYCFCAPELREKSVGWLHEANTEASYLADRSANSVIEKVNTESVDGEPVVVFNTLPHSLQSIVTTVVDTPASVVTSLDGSELPAEVIEQSSGKTQIRFQASANGLGYKTFVVRSLKEGKVREDEQPLNGPFLFENPYYRATIQLNGTFSSLVVLPAGEELLESSTNPGNLLLAHDSTGLGTQHEGTFDVINGEKWSASDRGPELIWQPAESPVVRRSSLGVVLAIPGSMGTTVKGILQINLYHNLARIDVNWSFTFNESSIGHFFDDDTKLRVQWPLAFNGKINHDIAFGVVESRSERPFLPVSWVDITDGNKGFAYFHTGTIKHWVREQTLYNLFAWGEYTDAIGNRLSLVRWPKCFDQRLRGNHTINTAIYPHIGDWRAADVIGAARAYRAPLMAYNTTRHAGKLPLEMNLLRIDHPEIVATVVRVQDNAILTRIYSVAQQALPLDLITNGLRQVKVASLQGTDLETIQPFQIAHGTFEV